MVFDDGARDRLQQHRLTGARRRDDQSTLPFPDRGREVHDAGAILLAVKLQINSFFRIKRRQVVEEDLVACRLQGLHN